MLFTPIVRPLDLGGTAALNYAVDERHVIDSESARIFVPQLGPFFKDTMSVVDVNTGNLLKEFEDYRLIHMVTEATHAANKEVDCVVYITNPTIGEVLISYQAIGGIYAEGSIALIEILDRFRNSQLPPVYWAQIINLPDVFPVTPHNHTMYDLEAIDRAISALTSVLDRLHARDIPKFQTLFDNLDRNINDLLSKGENYAQSLEQGFMRIESNALYRKGQVKITDNNTNPFDYLDYGSWVRLEEVLLYGAIPNDTTDPITNISNSTGHVARLTNFWEQISDVEGVSYTLTASTTAINEGQSVTFTVRTTGLVEGAKLNYVISGVNADDITSPLNGIFTINAAGVATVTITTKEDRLTEGVESLVLALKDYPSIRRSVNVNDTSRSPSYTIRYTSDIEGKNQINILDEGKDFYIFIQTEFVDDGQKVNLFYNGSTTANADFNANLPTQLTISGGRAAYKMTTKNDQLTEGNENLVTGVSLSSADAIVVSSVLTIRDTSKAPGYNIIYSVSDVTVNDINSIDEGVDFWCIIQTENVLNGTVLTINNAGTINDADFETKYPTTVTIQNNTAKFKMRLRDDLTTEGNEVLSISLMVGGTSIYTKPIAVNDSSPNPNANMKFSTNSSGTNSVTTANEGSLVYLILQTQGMPNGTVFNLVYSGTAETADFNVARPTTVTVNNNRAVVQYSVKADTLTDGREETMVITLQNSFNRENLGTVTLTIKDTSKASTYKLRFSANVAGTGSVTNANEGTVVYGVLETTDVDDGTTLKVATTIGGKVATVANSDVTINVATTVVVNKNRAIIPVTLNNDLTNENAEALVMTISEGTTTVATASITVNDTSKAPTYSGRLLVGTPSQAAVETSPAATNVLVGNKYGIFIQTTNVPNGTVLYVRRNTAVEILSVRYLADSAFTGSRLNGAAPPVTITVQNNKAWIPFQLYSGWLDSSPSTLLIGVYTAASGGSPVVRIQADVPVPSYELFWASNATGATRITAVDEGKSAYLIIKTSNVPDNVYLNAELFINNVSQLNTPNVDLMGAGQIAISLDLNITALKYDFIADELKEGNETFRMRVWPQHDMGKETPAWFRDVSITITDTSYRPDKIRAGVVSGQVDILGTNIESFDPAIAATFITPEGAHEAWSQTISSNNTSLKTNIWNRSGTSRVGYSGNTSWVVIDQRKATKDILKPWASSYHNEIATIKGDYGTTLTAANAKTAVVFVSPDSDHEAWSFARATNKITPAVFNRSGTSRIAYSGKISITAMKPYIPHYSQHLDAPYPRIVYAQVKEPNEAISSFEMFPYNLQDTTKYAIMFCPENDHEAWSIARASKLLTCNVFNRSGTSRVGYSGKVNWAIVQLKADSNIDRTTRRVYVPGGDLSAFQFKKNRTYIINVHGGGGAGGNAIYYHSGATELFGTPGGSSSITIKGSTATTAVMQSNGGAPGGRGCWNNGSAYRNGNSGNGGGTLALPPTANFTAANAVLIDATRTNGLAGVMSTNNVGNGGASPSCPESEYFGAGGKGHYGTGSSQHGYGGSGGGGGSIVALVRFNEDATGTVKVGAGGVPYDDPAEYYQQNWHYGYGKAGTDGIVVIEDVGNQNAVLTITPTLTIETDIFGFIMTESSHEGFNLYDAFYATYKRAPTNTDTILVYIPANVAAIGSTKSLAGIKIDARCNNAKSIHILNNGYIYGRGGSGGLFNTLNGGKLDPGSRVEAGPGIQNDSIVKVTVDNYGVIAGGGGYGGMGGISYVRSAGGGAPYGTPSKYGRPDRDELYPASAAKLHTGGSGSINANGNGYGGWGGDPGYDGKPGVSGTPPVSGNEQRVLIGKAGLRTIGNVAITNRAGGVVRGRTS